MTKPNVTTLYDEQCKIILSNSQILAYMIKNCVKECKDISMNELVEYFQKHPAQIGIEDISIPKAKIIYDIKIQMNESLHHLNTNLIINIEPQNNAYPGYNIGLRAIYYVARLISHQKGTIFKHSDFDQMNKVYSIWIICQHAKEDNRLISRVHYAYDENRKLKTLTNKQKNKIKRLSNTFDISEIIMIYPDINHTLYDGSFIDFFSLLFNQNISLKQKKLMLEEKYGIMMSEELSKEVGNMCNWSTGVIADNNVKHVKNLMKTMSLSLPQAMDALEIADNERPYIYNQLEDYVKKSKKKSKKHKKSK